MRERIVPKATIKSGSGALITIEGTQEEILRLISDYEKANSLPSQRKKTIPAAATANPEHEKREGASGLLIEMRESGFFDKPKTLADMEEMLEEKGFLYPTTTLSGVVLRLVKKKELRRKKADGRWVYGK
jgi:hypothetical protein